MPILKPIVELQIEALMNSLQSGDPTKKDPETTKREFISGLADIIINTIKSADVTIPPGLVIVAGSALSQTNPAPIFIPNSLS